MLADMATEIDAAELLIKEHQNLKIINKNDQRRRNGKTLRFKACVELRTMLFRFLVAMAILKTSQRKNTTEILNFVP